jgi:hypothetical protein
MEVQRGTVIDQVQRAVPPEKIRVPDRSVHVQDESVEPNHGGGQMRRRIVARSGIEHR